MERGKAVVALLALALVSAAPGLAVGPDLALLPADLRITANAEGGYDLYVRRKPDIASILLVETTQDPAQKADNFAYRASEWNPVNGDERRLLDGKVLDSPGARYSLVSSTPRPDPVFGQAFHILIPPVLVYGYVWSRSGSVAVGNGTFVNIRAFARPYADYGGAFRDNPYRIAVATRPPPVQPLAELGLPPQPPAPAPRPLPAPRPAPSPEPPPPSALILPPEPLPEAGPSAQIAAAMDGLKGGSLDLVLCVDTTSSMQPYMDDLKRNLVKLVRARAEGFESVRVGLLLFKDYWPEDYITRKIPFTAELPKVDGYIQGLLARGGGDIPEAVHEGLYAAATQFDWRADSRLLFLVTDSCPHPLAKGGISWFDAASALASRRISLYPLIVTPLGGGE